MRPKINANPDLQLASITWEAVQETNDPPELFVYENALVRTPFKSAEDRVVIEELDQNRLRHELIGMIDFFKVDRYLGEIPARPPLDLLQDILATRNPPLPILRGRRQLSGLCARWVTAREAGLFRGHAALLFPAQEVQTPGDIGRADSRRDCRSEAGCCWKS